LSSGIKRHEREIKQAYLGLKFIVVEAQEVWVDESRVN